MSARTVRADYEALTQVGQQFGRQTDAIRKTLQQLKRNMDVLQRGDWQGQGADKFYEEMNSAVLPSMQRLVNALDTAGQRTQDISRIMHEAEDDAAKLLRALGGAAPGSAAAFVQADRGPGRRRRPPAKPPKKALSVNDLVAQLDPKVMDIFLAGNKLFFLLDRLNANDVNITRDAQMADKNDIVIDPGVSVEGQLHSITFEYAQILEPQPPLEPKSMNRHQYVEDATNRQIRVDARRIFEEMELKAEIPEASGISFNPDFPSGTNAATMAEYFDIHDAYVKGDITEANAVSQIWSLVHDASWGDYLTVHGNIWDQANIEMQ